MKESMKKYLHVIILIVILVLTAGAAGAQTIICPAIADVSIDEWYPDENMNYKDRLILATNMNSHHGIARALLRFDIPAEVQPEEIKTAFVYFSGCSHCGGAKGGTIRMCALNDPFDENTDTWATLDGGNWDETVCCDAELPGGSAWNEAVNGEKTSEAVGMDITALLTGNLEKVRTNGIMIRFADEHQQPYTHQNIASRESEDTLDFAPCIVLNDNAAPCAAGVALGNDLPALETLRRFRDRVLAGSVTGRTLTALYNLCSPACARYLREHPGPRKQAETILRGMLPLVRRVLEKP